MSLLPVNEELKGSKAGLSLLLGSPQCSSKVVGSVGSNVALNLE